MKYFLILGNGRTGSTWLETSFDRLPDVRARREIKWRLPYQADHPMHRYIGGRTRSITDAFPSVGDAEPIRVVGSKLIFDPYGYLSRSVFDRLARMVDEDVKLIHLRRPYVEIFRSWKLRGVTHALSETAVASGDIDPVLVETTAQLAADSAGIKRMVLTVGGAPFDSRGESGAEAGAVAYPLEDAIDDLLVYFHNDVLARLTVMARAGTADVEHADVAERFSALARFVGSRAEEADISAIAAAPSTIRLDPLDASLVRPVGVLEQFSECLENAFRLLEDASETRHRLWRLDEGRRRASFDIPGLTALLRVFDIRKPEAPRRFNPLRRIGAERREAPGQWPLRKPVYYP